MHLRRLIAALVALMTGAALSLTVTGPAHAFQSATAAVSVPVTGTFTDANGGTGTFAGQFTPTRFIEQNGALAAVGTLTGTLTDSTGTTVGTANQEVTAPAAITQATCQILHLELGPLDLDLLGLLVHLDKIVLDISASQAPGDLLGNLLCAVARLLDPLQLGQLLAILNQILDLLR
jgi:hypothetical protein